MKISIAIFMIVIALSTIDPSNAQNDFLTAHNEARALVGVGPMTWDDNLTAYAENYITKNLKSTCHLVHSQGPYGENLAMGWGDMTALDAVKMWVDEGKTYNYEANSCAGGDPCGHYTQVVWRNSTNLGCAAVKCDMTGGNVIGCNYNPPGNYYGERPY